MKILITGGAGFVGANLAERLSTDGFEVLCMDNLVRRGSEINLLRLEKLKNVKFVHGDIRNPEDFDRIKFKPDMVLECSAQTTAVDGYTNPMYDITNNTTGLINVLEYCRKNNAGLIFWSTNKVYSGDLCNLPPVIENDTRFEWDTTSNFKMRGWSPKGFNELLDLNGGNHTIYGITKVTSDLFCQEWASAFGIPIIINRFSCLYGPNQFGMSTQGWIVWFALAKHFNLDLSFYGFGGKQVRDYLHIDDVCSLVKLQINNCESNSGRYYNVGGGCKNTISVFELNKKLDSIMSVNSNIAHKDPRKADQKIYISDITKVCDDFGWKPTVNIDLALEEITEWISKNEKQLSRIVGR